MRPRMSRRDRAEPVGATEETGKRSSEYPKGKQAAAAPNDRSDPSRASEPPRKANTAAYLLLCLASFCMYGSNNTLMALAPSYVNDLGFSMAIAGMQGSLFLAAAIVLRFVCTPLFGRWGCKPFLLIGAGSFCAAGALMLIWNTLEGLLIGRAVQAIGLAVYWPCASEAVMSIAPNGRTGSSLGFYRLVTKLSLMVGPVLAFEAVRTRGYDAVFACVLGISAIAGLLLVATRLPKGSAADGHGRGFFRNRGQESGDDNLNDEGEDLAIDMRSGGLNSTEPLQERRHGFALGDAARATVLLLGATAVGSFGYGLVTSYSPTLVAVNHPEINEGSFLSFFSLGCVIASPLVGMATDRISWRRILPFCLLALSAGIGIIGFLPSAHWALAPAGIVAGTGSAGGTVCILQGIARTFEGRKRSALVSHQQNCTDIAIAASSSIFGFLLAVPIEASAVFAGWAVLSGAAACILLLASLRHPT